MMIVNGVYANNLGNYGQIFPVIEEDLRHFIMRKLKFMQSTGELERYQHDISNKVAEHIIKPKSLGLTPTNNPQSFFVDPTQILNKDIFSSEGVLIAAKGTRLNPFEHVHFKKTLFFIDGDDNSQVLWAQKHYKNYEFVKFIFTGGNVKILSEKFDRVYFDVKRELVQKLHIVHVPSVVSQVELKWMITEIGIKDYA